ncbi:MAG: ribonuclease III [Planctomycetes bacterium]|nr:ribonuclease III [Planctomycetota bacterium]MCD7895933.1 ribonuclease III [Planctomycetaceae bacterium]
MRAAELDTRKDRSGSRVAKIVDADVVDDDIEAEAVPVNDDADGERDVDTDGSVDGGDDNALVEDVPVEVYDPDGTPRPPPVDERIRACEVAVGYTFFDKKLIKNALTHSSSTSDKRLDNERLEFFGDAVLDLVIREYLYHNYPNHQEGDLTEAKSAVVCRASLAKAGRKMDLKNFLFLGRGIGKKRAVPDSLLADAYEAIVAAIYLDGGYQPVKNFILMTLKDEIPFAIEAANSTNYKSNLQKILQQQKKPLPLYRVLGATGPEHSRVFSVAVEVDGVEMGRGKGSSKKAAEQEAAKAALEKYR